MRRSALLVPAILAGALLAPPTATAAVSVDRAQLRSGSLEVEGGGARSGATVTVISPESTASGRADSGGRFRIRASGYRSSTCRATVGDGSSSATATLSGCTVSSPSPPPPEPPPPPPPEPPPPLPPPPPPSTSSVFITPDVAELGPGFVGSDFTSDAQFSSLTLAPDALGPVRWSIASGALPAGLRLVNAFPNITPAKQVHGAITGTPTRAQTSTFTIRATDANGRSATRTYTIRIFAAKPLTITPQPWAPLTVGSFMNLWIDGGGGVRPYRWARVAGAFPPGMRLIQDNPSGPLVRIGGTPTAAGTFDFTLRLTDAQGSSVTRAFSVTVT